MTPADIQRIAADALPHLLMLVERFLPGGRLYGREYVSANLTGGKGDSCKFNIETGLWSDFATGEAGGDIVSLLAAIRDCSQSEAAEEIAGIIGSSTTSPSTRPAPPPKSKDPEWRVIMPVPADAPPPPAPRGATATWEYRTAAGELLHLVHRFDRGDSKEFSPLTYCTDGTRREWRRKGPQDPRPLYGLERLADRQHVLVVEGEKAADAARRLLGPGTAVITWSGGSNAAGKADWRPLAGKTVAIWPDADAPGHKAAAWIADHLLTSIGAASVRIVTPPAGVVLGWDPADAETEGWTAAEVEEMLRAARVIQPPADPAPVATGLDAFALNGDSAKMREQALKDVFVLYQLALLGQFTVFYAQQNVGKTLLILYLLIEAIVDGRVKPEDVYFGNADDHFKGLLQKTELGERYGFKMFAPGHKGFKAEMLIEILDRMIANGDARGKVIIVDTIKKFVDIMRKDKSSIFNEKIRQFVSHGGTFIALAHVNKHRDSDGKVIYAGTADVVQDCDCAYTLDIVNDDKTTGIRTVIFENIKFRGDVAAEATYQYSFASSMSYQQRLDSVMRVSDTDRAAAAKAAEIEFKTQNNRRAIEIMTDVIGSGITTKTEILSAAKRQGIPRTRALNVLEDFTGELWDMTRTGKNSHVYSLISEKQGGCQKVEKFEKLEKLDFNLSAEGDTLRYIRGENPLYS